MPLLPHHTVEQRDILRDVRTPWKRISETLEKTDTVCTCSVALAMAFIWAPDPAIVAWSDVGLAIILLYTRWFLKRPFDLPFKFPRYAGLPDPHNPSPGKPGPGKPEGILFLGNLEEKEHPGHGQELWLTNSDARTHILFLGTTGSGKTEGLKSIVSNALTWGSGFVYVDGKADTDLWASLYALTRRFGRDDDLLVLNYMTANSDAGAVSNTMNPFANGSASYLTNMVTSLMPDAGGDNAMWKERAIALLSSLMPALTWKRDHQGLLLDVSVLRDNIELPAVIRLSRDATLPERVLRGLQGYLRTLPGYVDAAFDDEGNEKPPSPDQPMHDLQVARQQHGYLSMQFTRSLQSLGDDYGYIFKAQLADIDILDVVLNRRILVALIPALEKSGEEAANLGKIIAASLKGMMGATLGNMVEGSWETAIESKQTRSSASFMAVFDEVGYYTAPGMAVMAAQARSLGFSLIFAAQDLPSMEKRVKQEAQSILGNCNLKIFGKLEDPTSTKKFFQDHVGTSWVMESKGKTAHTNTISSLFLAQQFRDDYTAGSATPRDRATWKHLRRQREGEVHMIFAEYIVKARMFHAVAGETEAIRVQMMLPVPASTPAMQGRERVILEMAERLKDKAWKAADSGRTVPSGDIAALANAVEALKGKPRTGPEKSAAVVGMLAAPRREGATAPTLPAARAANGKAAPAGKASATAHKPGGGATPLMQEGDEFAFEELQKAEKTNGAGASPHQGQPASATEQALAASELHESLAIRPGTEEDSVDMSLPESTASLLEQMAQRLNTGLREGRRE